MSHVSIFINRGKMPRDVRICADMNSKSASPSSYIGKALSEKLKSAPKKKKSEREAPCTIKSTRKTRFTSKDVLVSLHIPCDILNGICKIAEALNWDTESYIVKILSDEIADKHLPFCGGKNKTLK